MALHLVLLTAILAFALASTDQCVSSLGSSIDLPLRSHKNASGDWIITVDTRRLTREENPREFSVNVHQETRVCGRYGIEEHVSVSFVYPSLHDTSMSGDVEENAVFISTTTATSPSIFTTTATTPFTSITTATTPSTTTNNTTTPKSCPQSGYEFLKEFSCYKTFPSDDERKTWREAREQCMREGGDLMVTETERERTDVLIPLVKNMPSKYGPWMGVYIPQGEEDWRTVKGEPALSTWWKPGKPDNNATRNCAYAYDTGRLTNWKCTARQPFICEIAV